LCDRVWLKWPRKPRRTDDPRQILKEQGYMSRRQAADTTVSVAEP
jgi:hypothetical protein